MPVCLCFLIYYIPRTWQVSLLILSDQDITDVYLTTHLCILNSHSLSFIVGFLAGSDSFLPRLWFSNISEDVVEQTPKTVMQKDKPIDGITVVNGQPKDPVNSTSSSLLDILTGSINGASFVPNRAIRTHAASENSSGPKRISQENNLDARQRPDGQALNKNGAQTAEGGQKSLPIESLDVTNGYDDQTVSRGHIQVRRSVDEKISQTTWKLEHCHYSTIHQIFIPQAARWKPYGPIYRQYAKTALKRKTMHALWGICELFSRISIIHVWSFSDIRIN